MNSVRPLTSAFAAVVLMACTGADTLDPLSSLSADIVFVYIDGSESYDAKIVNESIEHHKNIIQETAEKNWKT